MFAMQGNAILGPAVDEAAEVMELVDAAVVWAAPSASALKRTLVMYGEPTWSSLAVDLGLPLRNGRSLRAPTLNPFVFSDSAEAGRIRRRIIGSMGGNDVNVIIKRQHTSRLFSTLSRTKIHPAVAKPDAVAETAAAAVSSGEA
jgi:hypothetical protein